MIVAGHQTDLLPYSGFWYKMAKADLFDLKIYNQFEPRGHQRRVAMRGRWASIPVVAGVPGQPIADIRIHSAQAREVLSGHITDRYRDAKNWSRLGSRILDMVGEIHTEHLWQFNLHLILGIREILDISTPISIARPPKAQGGSGLAAVMKQYRATTYLSGSTGKHYLGDCEELQDVGIDIKWSNHRPVTGDSILSVLMDYDDPMAIVMAENSPRLRSVDARSRRA